MRRILGIDPGSRFCGYGVVDLAPNEKPRYVECGVLQFEATLPLPQRLHQLAFDLRELIQELKPHDMAVETIFHGKNAQSAFRLGYARGVVMMISAECSLAFYEYSPNIVKRAVAGHGHAKKDEIQRLVTWQCGLRHAPQADAADALAVALCHAFQQNLLLQLEHRRQG